ncbi:MAG: (d)CMP kinase [Candidatus Krumholzibacteriota bacterium]|nr:(d)CMP kinase [Candidatus Krumholzibacteriota bacterium]
MDLNEKTKLILARMVVTIDGPAGSGKSTTASMLAEKLGLTYLDTGAMYRAVTWDILENKIDPEDEEMVTARTRELDLEMKYVEGVPSFFLGGEKLGERIRSQRVSSAVSPVSRHRGVREALVRIQRSISEEGGVVAEGRDTGTTVFPFADVKIYLVADIESRSKRRVSQLKEMGLDGEVGSIKNNLEQRDQIDSTRQHSPLRKPPGSVLVDTSGISIEDQVGLISDIVIKKAEELADLRVWPGEKNEQSKKPVYWTIVSTAIHLFYRVVFGLRRYGLENISYRENYIFASNHISYSDPPIIGSSLKRKIWFLAKKELFKNFLFGWLIRKFNAIPVKRGEADRVSVKTITEKLMAGDSVLLFPEGTRSRNGKIRKLKSGIGYYALQTGRPIVPLFISGADDLKACFLRKKKMEVRIGRPVRIDPDYHSDDKKEDYNMLAQMTMEEMVMMKNDSEN